MAYSNGAAVFRADLSGLVMETTDWEKGLIASRVCPVINVETKDGQYPLLQRANGRLLKNDKTLQRGNGSNYARGTFAWGQDTYATQEYGFELPVDYNVVKDQGRFYSVEQVQAQLSKRPVLLQQELRAAALTFNTTNYGAATNSATAYTVANIATFDIGLDIDASKERIRAKGESAIDLSVIMSRAVFDRARASTKLQNRLRGIGVASDTILNITEEAVAEALNVKEVIVGNNYYDTALEGQAFSGSAIWGNTYLWVGKLGSGGSPESIFNGGAQFCLNWGAYGPPLAIASYEEPQTNSRILRASQHVVEKVTNANQGDLIATQYS